MVNKRVQAPLNSAPDPQRSERRCGRGLRQIFPKYKAMLKTVKHLIAGVMGAAPCWVMAILFFRVWQTPMVIDEGRWVKLAVGIMVLEFILVHSGGFFGALSQRTDKTGKQIAMRHRIALMAGLVCCYLAFAVAFSIAFKSWYLFGIFCWVTASRMLSMVLDTKQDSNTMMVRSGVSGMLYVSGAFLSIFVRIPRAGITPEVLNAVYPGRGSGEWEQNPQQALFAGMFYFGLLGLWELVAPFMPEKKKDQNQKKQGTF